MINVIPKPNYLAVTGGERPYSEKNVTFEKNDALEDEEYHLEITKEKILVSAKGEKGFFYGKQTLKQLSFLKETVPCLMIKDKPRYPYRAFMIDSSRHMQTIDEIKTYINEDILKQDLTRRKAAAVIRDTAVDKEPEPAEEAAAEEALAEEAPAAEESAE